MTVTSTNIRDDYTATASQTTFVITFQFFDAAEIRCWEDDVERFLGAGDDDFTITGGDGAGGSLIFNTGRTLDVVINIRRNSLRTRHSGCGRKGSAGHGRRRVTSADGHCRHDRRDNPSQRNGGGSANDVPQS